VGRETLGREDQGPDRIAARLADVARD